MNEIYSQCQKENQRYLEEQEVVTINIFKMIRSVAFAMDNACFINPKYNLNKLNLKNDITKNKITRQKMMNM